MLLLILKLKIGLSPITIFLTTYSLTIFYFCCLFQLLNKITLIISLSFLVLMIEKRRI